MAKRVPKSPSGFISALAYFLSLITVVAFFYLLFLTYYQGRIFPNVKVASFNLGGQTPSKSFHLLKAKFEGRVHQPLTLHLTDQDFTLDLTKAQPKIDASEVIDQAYSLGRSGDFLRDLKKQFTLLTSGAVLTPKLSYQDLPSLNSQMANLNFKVKKDPVDARFNFAEVLTIIPSQNGEELDKDSLIKQVNSYLTFTQGPPEVIPLKSTSPKITTAAARVAKVALDRIQNSPLKLQYQGNSWTIDQPALLSLLDFNQIKATASSSAQPQLIPLDRGRLVSYLADISTRINRPVQEAKFIFDPTSKKVGEFQPAQVGQELDIDQTAQLISQALSSEKVPDIILPIKTTPPKLKTADVNSFGIQELLGEGISYFTGSIENRIYNISLAASKINGVLLAPGETFSFNNTVGDITAATGFKQAYVIKSGRTVLDDGGGVCQVSTTLFRAVLRAGLPIKERTAHAYRVGYYEQGFPPGQDATIFYPWVDFKFTNDTPGYILIQASIQGTGLYIDLYGTSDGRVSLLSFSKVASQVRPPDDLRQDDPTLPKGVVKQVDWSAWGADVSFLRKVVRGGQTIISENWYSHYRPWQAVFLVGTEQ